MLETRQTRRFGLNLNKNVVATITDNTCLVVNFGKETRLHHVTSYTQAIHLAGCDVLYKIPKYTPSEAVDAEFSTKDEEDCELVTEITPDLSAKLQNVVKKVCKIVKIFRRSPVKNGDNLQSFVLEHRFSIGVLAPQGVREETSWSANFSFLTIDISDVNTKNITSNDTRGAKMIFLSGWRAGFKMN